MAAEEKALEHREWTCEGCGSEHRMTVERVVSTSFHDSAAIDVRCKCGGDKLRSFDFTAAKTADIVTLSDGAERVILL